MTATSVPARLAQRLPSTAAPLAAAGLALGVCVAVNLSDPNVDGSFGRCPFLAVTGYQCPGCGTLRAVRALTRGQVGTAFGLNVLTVAVLPLLLWGWFGWFQHRRGRREAPPEVPTVGAVALAVVVPLFWLLRNVPVEPFSWLAP